MSFDTNKSLRYDPKGIMHERRIDMKFKGYEDEHDEMLVALANTDLFDHIEIGNGSSNSSDRDNQGEATGKQTEVPNPLKVENF